jgi:hypothetical protein
VVLGGALPFWPYAHACGWRLWLYCGAVFVLLVVGVRAALVAWRERAGLAQTLALLAGLWALTLGAGTVLPRVHYARATGAWTCGPEVPAPRTPARDTVAPASEGAGPAPGAADSGGTSGLGRESPHR